MATVAVCPECRKRFPWKVELGYPQFCPLCGFTMGCDRADDDIVIPFIRSEKFKSSDSVYRDMEKASERRAEMAAEMAGTSVEDMSVLKITDMKDNTREGEIAAPSVGANLAALGMRSLDQGFTGNQASEYGQQVQSGPLPNMGAKMRTALQTHHSKSSGGMAVSDRPALETTAPNYRRRG